MRLVKRLKRLIWNSRKSSPLPKLGQLVRTGHAVLIKDPISSANLWYTFGKKENGGEDEKGEKLNPNESLVFPTNLFGIGTRIEIYERAEK